MQLVGAPQAYIRGPFVMEGVLQGGLGALVALIALGVAVPRPARAVSDAAGVGAEPFVAPLPAGRALRVAGRSGGWRSGAWAGWSRPGIARRLRNLDSGFTAALHWIHQRRQFISRTCMPRFVHRFEADQRAAPDHRVLPGRISQTSPLSTAAAGLLFRERDYRRRSRALENHGQARTTLHARQRPATRQLTPQEIRRRDRPFGLVRSQADTLTRSLRRSSTRSPGDRPGRYRCGRAGRAGRARARESGRPPSKATRR